MSAAGAAAALTEAALEIRDMPRQAWPTCVPAVDALRRFVDRTMRLRIQAEAHAFEIGMTLHADWPYPPPAGEGPTWP